MEDNMENTVIISFYLIIVYASEMTSETMVRTIISHFQHKNEGTGATILAPLKPMATLVFTKVLLGFIAEI